MSIIYNLLKCCNFVFPWIYHKMNLIDELDVIRYNKDIFCLSVCFIVYTILILMNKSLIKPRDLI